VTVYLVGAGPGDPGLLTRRGAELLARADVVVYDRLVDPSVLDLAPDTAEMVDVGKRPGDDAMRRQEHINQLLVEFGRRDATVVRLKGGDPFLFGRGGEEAQALSDATVDWEIVPGVPSAFAVPAYSGVPVTHRGTANSVTVVTGHVGDLARPRGVDWISLGKAGGTLVILMGMERRKEIASELLRAGRSPDEPVVVTQWGSTPRERHVRTTLADLGDVELGSPSVIVVGAVAGLELKPPPRPLTGLSVVVTRASDQAGPLVSALSDAGARVIELPMIRICDAPDGGSALLSVARDVQRYSWVVFTSTNAVHRFVPLLRDGRSLAGVKLAAVGRATRDALARYNLVADVVPATQSARALVDALPDAPGGTGLERLVDGSESGEENKSRRVLFPRAEIALDTVPEGLRRKGWQVDEVVAYTTSPVTPVSLDQASAAADAGWAIFTSPSTVENYLAARDDSGASLVVPAHVVCVGGTTAAAARRAGLDVAVEVDSLSPNSIVKGITNHLGPLA
jgi:uroporphyrinogen III methyltransferase/synthase